MIGILLSILKIIGIVMLVILGLIIVNILLVLFVPVRYDISGHYYEKEDYGVGVKISYLLHIISFSLIYEKKLFTSIKIFGLEINSDKNKSKDKEEKNTKKKQKKSKEDKKKKKKKDQKPENSEEKLSTIDKIKEFADGHDLDYVIHFMINQMVYFLNSLAPKKVKLDVEFGFKNPAYTGWTLAGLSMVSWVYKDGVDIIPYFELAENKFKGSGEFKGRIRLITFVIIFFRVWFDKEVRRTIFDIVEFGGTNGK